MEIYRLRTGLAANHRPHREGRSKQVFHNLDLNLNLFQQHLCSTGAEVNQMFLKDLN